MRERGSNWLIILGCYSVARLSSDADEEIGVTVRLIAGYGKFSWWWLECLDSGARGMTARLDCLVTS